MCIFVVVVVALLLCCCVVIVLLLCCFVVIVLLLCCFVCCCCFLSVRVLPHHQDTGGFFIAILEKQDWLPWQNKARASSAKAAAMAEATATAATATPATATATPATMTPPTELMETTSSPCTSDANLVPEASKVVDGKEQMSSVVSHSRDPPAGDAARPSATVLGR